jgi:uncharacterized membrane protein YgcG
MTAPRTENDTRPDTDEKPARLQLSPVQVAAGALAAVSSAVVLSFFGVAGTVIGAALASVVSTVGSALYSASLNRTNEGLRRARAQLATRPAAASGDAATRQLPASGDAATRELPATRELLAGLDPPRAPPRVRRIRWPRVAAYAAAVFVLGMGIVTGIELIGQQPVSALVGGSDTSSSSTTIGELSNASSSRDVTPTDPDPADPTGTPTEAPVTETPEDGAEESAVPTDGSEESTPATESGSSDDSDRSSPAEPSTQAPQTSGGSGSSAGNGTGSGSGSGSGNGSGSSPQADAGTGSSPAA